MHDAAARPDGFEQVLVVVRYEDEDSVVVGLLEGFQKRALRSFVHAICFLDDEDLRPALERRTRSFGDQHFPDHIDGDEGTLGLDVMHVGVPAPKDPAACRTLAASRARLDGAIQRRGHRDRGNPLAGSTGAEEQPGVSDLSTRDLSRDVLGTPRKRFPNTHLGTTAPCVTLLSR
jgi:hypothetical protein